MDWLFRFADPSIDWHYAMATLLVRFIGVFAVMIVMQIALQIAAAVVRQIEKPGEPALPGGAPAALAEIGAPTEPPVVEEEGLDGATAAAIGLALALSHGAAVPEPPPPPTTPWATSGRAQQLHRLPR